MNQEQKMLQFLNSFSMDHCDPFTSVYRQVEKAYCSKFKHSVPREMLPDSISTEVLMKAMQECIDTNEDKLFEILGITINEEFLY